MGCKGSKAANSFDTSSVSPQGVLVPDSFHEKATTDGRHQGVVKPFVAKSGDVTELFDSVFRRLDVNGDGLVSKDELSSALQSVLDCSELETQKTVRTMVADSGLNPYFYMFDQLHTNPDGKVSRDALHANLHPARAAVHVEQHLKDIFQKLDLDGNGCVSKTELSLSLQHVMECSDIISGKSMKVLMADAGLDPADSNVFDQLDANRDGHITWAEFSSKLKPQADYVKELVRNVFAKLDTNGDGHVSKEELTTSYDRILDCSHYKTKKTFRAMVIDAGLNPDFYIFEQLDTNQDGKITWDEFESNLQPQSQEETPVVEKLKCQLIENEKLLADETKQEENHVADETQVVEHDCVKLTGCSFFWAR